MPSCAVCENLDKPTCMYCVDMDRFEPLAGHVEVDTHEEEDDCPNGACEIPDKEE